MNKKKKEKTMEIVVEKYTKEQIIKSKKYNRHRDVLISILEENKSYSIEDIEQKIKEFLKRKVK